MDPSSRVINNSWFSESTFIKSTSSGLANLASATVTEMPNCSNSSDASSASLRCAPKLNIATLLPSLQILPFPSSRTSPLSGSSTPIPSPLGYLNDMGPSLYSAEVLIICISSNSSDAAITTKPGKLER